MSCLRGDSRIPRLVTNTPPLLEEGTSEKTGSPLQSTEVQIVSQLNTMALCTIHSDKALGADHTSPSRILT